MTAALVSRLLLRRASLGGKLVLILTAVGIGGALAITLLLALIITPSFGQLETRLAVADDVTLLGRRMLALTIAGSTLLLLLLLMVLRRMIARLVLAPLARVEAHMERVSGSGTLSPLEDNGRCDEIGSLGRSFNAMLSQLADLRGQIEVQSFALGRSESAVAVMHNVRNALNPVSTILTQGLIRPAAVDRAMLRRALTELAGDRVDPERRAKLVAFVGTALDADATERDRVRGELDIGRQAMAQVLNIIGDQQRRAHERPPLEAVDLGDSARRNAAIARCFMGLVITVALQETDAMVLAHRIILDQVIGNLLGNAAEAIAATGRGSGTIVVTVDAANGQIRLIVEDDGEGFDGDATPLFGRGYSTRADKSGGLGLHWCSNAVAAMGGTLALQSKGSGMGARAVLTLVAAPPLALVA